MFPCNPKNKQPLLASQKDDAGKPIRGTGGVSAASTDPEQVRAWWKRWPKALIGLATGHPTIDAGGARLFVVDFDPRTDEATGEVWQLAGLKADTEAMIGEPLPESLTALTPSDGVHLYLLQDDGEPITNRGNLPQHVDVRGLGGYVIAPPSVMAADAIKGQGGLRYRWHRQVDVAPAPDGLLKILRERGRKAAAPADYSDPLQHPAYSDPLHPRPAVTVTEALRKYALAALDSELQAVRTAPSGQRNAQLNESAFSISSLVAAGVLDQAMATAGLEAAARDNPGNDDDRQLQATIASGWSAGIARPRDLSQIEAAARERSDRNRSNPARPRHAGPSDRRPAPSAGADQERPFRSGSAWNDNRGAQGREARPLTPGDQVRLKRIAECWLQAKVDQFEPDAKRLSRLAWGAGCRIAAQLLGGEDVRAALHPLADKVAGVTIDDVDQAVADGIARGFDPAPQLLDLDCARYPMTDFGIAERFRDRFGEDFRFTTAKGWLGWDGRRWKVLDQDQDTPPAELVAAVFDTIRGIQREAKAVAGTGHKWDLVPVIGPKGGQYEEIADDRPPNPHAADYWIAKGKGFVLFSGMLAAWGRQSETTGKPAAVAALARRWLTVPIEDFDCEQMAINVMNGTLRFITHPGPGDAAANEIEVRLDPHRRDDLITRLAPVDYNREAPAPLYDGMIAWAQPDDPTRRYLHQVAGYSCTGHTGEHLLWFHYGRGRNGKSVTIDTWSAALGDYSGTIGIESFLDQGVKKRGDAATPDLAKLGGVRLLRASEPERGAKLNAALVKMATGGEPLAVRALHRGFFDLLPRFKLQMSGNIKPAIPDTDDGIWGRMKLVPWSRHIEKPEADPFRDRFPQWHHPGAWPAKDIKLADKIKAAELPGVFARLVAGLVDYLAHGFVEPDSVTAATEAYRDQSDPLARFLALCTEADPASRVKSSELHDVFAAWCKAVGEKEWSPKGFSDALTDKGFTKVRSDGMRWEGLKLTRRVGDFLDAEGKVRSDLPDLTPADPVAAAPRSAFRDDDDDLPIA